VDRRCDPGGALLSDEQKLLLLDVTPLSLGIATYAVTSPS